ncbi:glycosyltransferase family 2 protein [Klebsiella quasipneumoniae]|uniref:glycosyltransferase family 2 protein n=1 Tax=Klebsiella quasipneumoniae TaxID=1463165 RepID=UPI001FCB4EEA|nr:glycosyltransferase family 2 protein [Klebsiella quasipneumoniae]MCJ4882030.1 glycosyltransferase [Klebsiella quasipneumoniae]
MKYFIAIPTYNAGNIWQEVVSNIKKYAPDNIYVHVIDSGSTDQTVEIAREAGFNVVTITSQEFNHGGTRNQAVFSCIGSYDIVIFLTQDAIPQQYFIENIISVFKDDNVACAYGRQLPHKDANPLAKHAREFNYSAKSYICGKKDISRLGLKTVFMSNSFSAYRLSYFQQLNGFPSETILCEDMFFTAKAILADYQAAYVANAMVRHSHNYSATEEFKRYFDIGVFHTDEPWIQKEFAGAGGEGKKYIISEINFLLKEAPLWIPVAFINNAMKLLGYKFGKMYKLFPLKVVKIFSMHKKYWKNN